MTYMPTVRPKSKRSMILLTLRALFSPATPAVEHIRGFYSQMLGRPVDFDIYLPPNYDLRSGRRYPLLICNDGQDLPDMEFTQILERMYRTREIPHIIAVGIHANHDRIREYGTAELPDYKGRGDKAAQYRDFVMIELLSWLYANYRLSGQIRKTAYAGFSLGGLSAFDIGWHYPQIFGTIGVFSGSFWWRSGPFSSDDPDAGRIAHNIVLNSADIPENQRFWFQTGTCDEQADRNNNGIIDAIDDTCSLIENLKIRGVEDSRIQYVEMINGEHNTYTWARAMPGFLKWAFKD